ncbi:MAG: hypothetical protein Q9220_006294 [cf. Caloplaca sp. 1 TL-2023]
MDPSSSKNAPSNSTAGIDSNTDPPERDLLTSLDEYLSQSLMPRQEEKKPKKKPFEMPILGPGETLHTHVLKVLRDMKAKREAKEQREKIIYTALDMTPLGLTKEEKAPANRHETTFSHNDVSIPLTRCFADTFDKATTSVDVEQCKALDLDGAARAVADFPSRYIYGQHLDTASFKSHDNAICQSVRMISSEKYGIRGKKGSEYFWLDVPKTISRKEGDSESMRNYGNADAICQLVDNLIEAGIAPRNVVILCYYQSQRQLLIQRLVNDDTGRASEIEISTVAHFENRKAEVVILDLVVAETLSMFGSSPRRSTYLRDPEICKIATTRAKDALIVVGQLGYFASGIDRNGGQIGNPLFYLARDAHCRQLIYSAEDILDSHPDAIEERQNRHEAVSRNHMEQKERRARIAELFRRGHRIIQDATKLEDQKSVSNDELVVY